MPNIEKAKNQAGKTIFPVTVSDAVLMGNGKTLKGELTELGSQVGKSYTINKTSGRISQPLVLKDGETYRFSISVIEGTDERGWTLYRYRDGALVNEALSKSVLFGESIEVEVPEGDDGVWLFTSFEFEGDRTYEVYYENLKGIAHKVYSLNKKVDENNNKTIALINNEELHVLSNFVDLNREDFLRLQNIPHGLVDIQLTDTSYTFDGTLYIEYASYRRQTDTVIIRIIDDGDLVVDEASVSNFSQKEGIVKCVSDNFIFSVDVKKMIEEGKETTYQNYFKTLPLSISKIKENTDNIFYKESEEYVKVIVDRKGNILIGIRKDGVVVIPRLSSILTTLTSEGLDVVKDWIKDTFEQVTDNEYVKVILDSKRNVVFGINKDGTCFMPKLKSYTINSINNNIEKLFNEVENIKNNGVSMEYGKTGVVFGDSIIQGTGLVSYNENGYDVPSVIGKKLQANVYNMGIGGTTYTGSQEASFVDLVNTVVSGDYTKMDAFIAKFVDTYAHFRYMTERWNKFKALDFNKVDFVVVAYGTNDWGYALTLDNDSDSMDTNTILGSLRYGITQLLTKYPHLKIYVATPNFRYKLGSDDSLNSDILSKNGLYLYELGDKIKEVCDKIHVNCLNHYRNSGLNIYTASYYLTDGTHRNKEGAELLGTQYAKFILSC